MTPTEYEVLKEAAEGGRTAVWFEAAERRNTTNDLMWGKLIEKVDLHKPDTGVEPTYYRATDAGRKLISGVGWSTAKTVALDL